MDTKQVIADQFEKWNNALQTGNPDEIVKLYAEDGILWGTLSPVIRPGRELIREYFVSFAAKEGIHGKVTDQHIRIYGDIAINSGSYTFFWKQNGKDTSLDARFTYVYRKKGDDWMIIEHHSSMVPGNE